MFQLAMNVITIPHFRQWNEPISIPDEHTKQKRLSHCVAGREVRNNTDLIRVNENVFMPGLLLAWKLASSFRLVLRDSM